MSQRRTTLIPALLAAALVAGALPARATAVAGPGGTAQQGRRIVYAAPVAPGAAAVELAAAVVDAVRIDRGEIVIHGKTVALHPTRLKVFRDGHPASAAALHAGQAIRFALDSTASDAQRIVLILIDR